MKEAMMHRPAQIPLALEMRPVMGRAHFLIGPSNQAAVQWIDRWPDWSAPLLFLSGPAASGKTHLAAMWQDKAQAVSLRPETLMTQGAEALAAQGRHLVLEGVDAWFGAPEAETALFHLYNIFKEEGRSFLCTGRMTPSQAEFSIADLASRFRAAPLAEIRPPDEVLLASVLIKLFSDRQLRVGNDVIRYLLPRMERSFSAARDIVMHADRVALAQKRPISVPLLRGIMGALRQDDLLS